MVAVCLPTSLGVYLQLYFGLLVFVGYVILDTQGIIEEAYNEDDPDYVKHALYLLTDFVAIIFRILAIGVRCAKCFIV